MPNSDAENDATTAAVGERLRRMRRSRGLSGRFVAREAGVSPAYLSRLENGKVSPTVSTLSRVVRAMDATVAELFGAASGGPVVRRADRRLIRNRGADDHLLTPDQSGRLEVLETVVGPGMDSGEAYAHPGDEECVVVLDGSLRLWLDGDVHDLETGDSATFACRIPHRWANPTSETTRLHWIITPAGGY